MKKSIAAIIVAASALASTGASAATAFNSAPADGWFYGSGNNYSPANTAVTTTKNGDQLALRWHKTFEVAPASDGHVYSFALGTTPLSFDWGIDNNDGAPISALLTLTNLGTGATLSYDPLLTPDNAVGNGSTQNSARLTFAVFSSLGFDPTINNTYRAKLLVGGLDGPLQHAVTVDARFGTGAVPEPATWAMMIAGFGFVGAAARRRSARVAFA